MTDLDPGWYADPLQPGQLRLWDGSGWTEQIRLGSSGDPAPAPPSIPTPQAQSFSPPPGWYPDPESTGNLRLWDGTRWTKQTRYEVHRTPGVAWPRTLRSRALAAAAAAAALVIIVVLLSRLATGGSRPSLASPDPSTTVPRSVAASNHQTLPPPSTGPDCGLAQRRMSPETVVNYLSLHGIPMATTHGPPVATGACASTAFTDQGIAGLNVIVSYPDSASATAAAAAAKTTLTFSRGIYVVILDPALRIKLAIYKLRVAQLVALTHAST